MGSSRIIQRLEAAVDPAAGEPLSHQIVARVWLDVVEGTLPTGARLPTARQLAIALGITPRAVERAYRELERLGVISTRTGEGSFVSLTPPSDEERRRRRELERLCREAVEGALALGFEVDDLLEALADFRDVTGADPTSIQEPS